MTPVGPPGRALAEATPNAATVIAIRTDQAIYAAQSGIVSLAFVDLADGWMVRGRGGGTQVLHTTDGGATWVEQYRGDDPIPAGGQFLDANDGWVVGNGGGSVCRQVPNPTCQGVVLWTTNGGRTWNPSAVPWVAAQVAFTRPSDGWLLDWSGCTKCQDRPLGVLQSADGGKTWRAYPLVRETNYSFDGARIVHGQSDEGWILTSDLSLSTFDAWQTWTTSASPCVGVGTAVVDTGTDLVPTLAHGWAACGRTDGDALHLLLYRTDDAGQSWQPVGKSTLKPVPWGMPPRLVFINDKDGWLAAGGVLYRTHDDGNTWRAVTLPGRESVDQIAFVDVVTGWVAGRYHIWRTADGGAHWQRFTLPP